MPIPIGDRAAVLWSNDPLADNRSFLVGMDPLYFRSVAAALNPEKRTRDEQFAAIAIRTMRDQAAEMLFSLLAASIQAPNGVALWLLLYRNDELDSIIEGFGKGATVRTMSGQVALKWNDVANDVTRHFTAEDPANLDKFRRQQSEFWRRLGSEFLDPTNRREYASLKHALRAMPGGCRIVVKPESSPGVADPNAKGFALEGSGFGSGFYIAERIGDHKSHYRLVHQHCHWSPESLRLQLDLIVNSIANVIHHLLLVNGKSGLFTWERPDNDEVFELCWKNDGSLLTSSFGTQVAPEDIVPLTQKELLVLLDAVKPADTSSATPPESRQAPNTSDIG
jgi:hypothetical protein